MLRYGMLASVLVALAMGCKGSSNNRSPMPIARGTSTPIRPLAIADTKPPRVQPVELDDPALLIPPPPQLTSLQKTPSPLLMPAIPSAPNQEREASPRELIIPTQATKQPQESRPNNKPVTLNSLYQQAADQYAKIDSFEARLTRREAVGVKEAPKEVIRFKFRKKPLSVSMKWIGDEGAGRELMFVEGKFGNKMQVLPAKEDTFPLPPVKLAFAPDDPMVRSKSRHDIRNAGMGTAIDELKTLTQMIEKDPTIKNRIQIKGLVQRPEYTNKLQALEVTLVPGHDPLLPRGGKRFFFFDTATDRVSLGLPVLVITHDDRNREVEYYCFDRFLHPVQLDDSDFNPEFMGRR